MSLNVRLVSLRGKVWADKTSLSSPCLIEVHVTSQESERPCVCVFEGIDFASSYDFLLIINCSDNVAFLCSFNDPYPSI